MNSPSHSLLSNTLRKPLVGIICDVRMMGVHPFHVAGDKYIRAVEQCAGVLPVLLPAFGGSISNDEIIAQFDGFLFTGSPSNIEPHHYGKVQRKADDFNDPQRDATSLSLIPALIKASVPVLGICRGFQEMNVAFGGSLHQEVHNVDGFDDHREDKNADVEAQYGPAHDVVLEKNGKLAAIVGADRITVNSVHGQGIDQLAKNFAVEARALDGLVEAYSIRDASTFALAVQWHPEWKAKDNPISVKLFQAFGDACRQRSSQRK